MDKHRALHEFLCIGNGHETLIFLSKCTNNKKESAQPQQNSSCAVETKQTGLSKVSFSEKTQGGLYKCHSLGPRLETFSVYSLTLTQKNLTYDTGTAAWGRVPPWALRAPFLWPVKATAWGDARSLICAARLVPEEHFLRRERRA